MKTADQFIEEARAYFNTSCADVVHDYDSIQFGLNLALESVIWDNNKDMQDENDHVARILARSIVLLKSLSASKKQRAPTKQLFLRAPASSKVIPFPNRLDEVADEQADRFIAGFCEELTERSGRPHLLEDANSAIRDNIRKIFRRMRQRAREK